jgi:hypothetical protein
VSESCFALWWWSFFGGVLWELVLETLAWLCRVDPIPIPPNFHSAVSWATDDDSMVPTVSIHHLFFGFSLLLLLLLLLLLALPASRSCRNCTVLTHSYTMIQAGPHNLGCVILSCLLYHEKLTSTFLLELPPTYTCTHTLTHYQPDSSSSTSSDSSDAQFIISAHVQPWAAGHSDNAVCLSSPSPSSALLMTVPSLTSTSITYLLYGMGSWTCKAKEALQFQQRRVGSIG